MAIESLQKSIIDGVAYNNIKFDDIILGRYLENKEDPTSWIGLGYVVQASPNYEYAEHETENIRIPGKNGDIVHYTGAYLNTTRQYNLVKILKNEDDYRDHSEFVGEAKKLVGKLKSKTGYHILQDTFEPDYYRWAVLKNAGVVVNAGDQAVSITLEFECKPQRWLVSGDDVTNDLENETDFDALPEITVNKGNTNTTVLTITSGTGNNVEVQTFTIDWTKGDKSSIVIDSELMDCYATDDGTNTNSYLGFVTEFPKLKANNQNAVSVVNGTVSVKPRWWTL